MALMYAMWLPLPKILSEMLNNETLIVGEIFGVTYLIIMIITMSLQTGHLVYIEKQENNKVIWEERNNWIMATFAGPLEVLANIFKCIWALFLAIAFLNNNNLLMGTFMLLFSSLIVYFLIILINQSLVKPLKFLSVIKSNPYFFNLETFLFFLILMIYSSSY